MAPYGQYRLVSQPEGPELAPRFRASVHAARFAFEGEAESRGCIVGSQGHTGSSCPCAVNGENDPKRPSWKYLSFEKIGIHLRFSPYLKYQLISRSMASG